MRYDKPTEFERPVYLQGLPEGLRVMVCCECGALVDFYKESVHRQWHEYIAGKEDSSDD